MRRFFSIVSVVILGMAFVGTGLGVAETPTTGNVSSMSSTDTAKGVKPGKVTRKPKTHKPARAKKVKPTTKPKTEKTGQATAPVQQ